MGVIIWEFLLLGVGVNRLNATPFYAARKVLFFDIKTFRR